MRLTFLFCVGWLVTSIQCDWNETNDTDLASSTTLKVLKSFVDSKLITFPPYEHYPQDKDEFSKHMLRGSDDPDVDVCASLQNSNNADIRMIGADDGNVTVVTRRWNVLQVPTKNLLDSDRLVIDRRPKDLQEAWPQLSQADGFSKLKEMNTIRLAIAKTSKGSPFLSMITNGQEEKGLHFMMGSDAGSQPLMSGWSFSEESTTAILSSNVEGQLFTLRKPVRNALQIATLDTTTLGSGELNHDHYKFVCKDGNSIKVQAEKCQTDLNWFVNTGFSAHDKLYFFGVDGVYVFHKKALTGQNAEVKSVPYTEFYMCNNTVAGSNSAAGTKIYIYAGIGAFVLLFVLIGIFCVCRRKNTKSGKSKRSRSHRSTHRSGGSGSRRRRPSSKKSSGLTASKSRRSFGSHRSTKSRLSGYSSKSKKSSTSRTRKSRGSNK